MGGLILPMFFPPQNIKFLIFLADNINENRAVSLQRIDSFVHLF